MDIKEFALLTTKQIKTLAKGIVEQRGKYLEIEEMVLSEEERLPRLDCTCPDVSIDKCFLSLAQINLRYLRDYWQSAITHEEKKASQIKSLLEMSSEQQIAALSNMSEEQLYDHELLLLSKDLNSKEVKLCNMINRMLLDRDIERRRESEQNKEL